MIGQSLPEYIFIRLSIAGLRLVSPLSTLYIAVSLYTGRSLLDAAGIYAAAEVFFYWFVFLPRKTRMQLASNDMPRLTREERMDLFEKCAKCMTEESTGGWFLPSSDGDSKLRYDNARDWLLWSLFSSKPDEILEEWEEELHYYVSTFANYVGYPLQRGNNMERPSLRLAFDPVIMLHRPLLWYTLIAIVDTITSTVLLSSGFRHYNTARWFHVFPPRPLLSVISSKSADPDVSYWYRPHRSKDKLPILFLHGIGIGLWPYLPFFRALAAQDPDVGILALELLPISARMTSPLPPRAALLNTITRVLSAHGVARFVVASHSYGTTLAAFLLRSPTLSPRVAGTLFVDPIPFLLHHPAVAYNFCYRHPRTANEWQLWFFAARDPDIARALGRSFHWHECVLFREQLVDGKAAVALAGRDQIVDTPAVRRYLTGEDEARRRWEGDGLEVLWFEGIDHAQVFDAAERRKPLLEVMRRFVRLRDE